MRLGIGIRLGPNNTGGGTPTPSLPTYTAVPTTATFAESPVEGYRVMSDSISLLQWGLNLGTAVAGDGAAALAANTDAAHPRDQLLKFSTAAGTGNAYCAEKLRFCAHNGERNTTAGSDVSMAAGYWSAEFLPVSGECVFFRAMASTVQQFRLGIADAGSGFFFLVLNNAVIGLQRSYGTMLKVRVSWDAAGNFVVASKTTGSWRTEFNSTGTPPSAITNLYWGTMGATKATDLRFSATAISNVSFAQIDRDYYTTGSGTRDVNQTAAGIALFAPAGMYDATQARIRHATGANPSGGTAGSWVALSGAVQSILPIPLTGLTANTGYSYQFEIGDAGGNVIWTSEAYQFRTLANAGTAVASKFKIASCQTQTPKGHPYIDEAHTLAAVDSSYIGTFLMGDIYYEANEVILESPYLSGNPPESANDFEQMLREAHADTYLDRMLKSGMYWSQVDDHSWINDGDGSTKPGGPNAAVLANAWGGDQSADGYGAAVTVSQLYTAAMTANDAWYTSHRLDVPSSGARYQHKTHGQTELIILDTRTERLPSSNLYISATQLAWIKTKIDAIAASTKIVLFVAQSGFATYTTKASEGWERLAVTQFRDFIDYCIANIPSGVQWGLVKGDDHYIFNKHENFSTTANPTLPANCLGEVLSSGLGMAYFNGASGGLGQWVFNASGLTAANPYVRSSGVLFEVDAAGSVDLSIQVAGVEYTHVLYAGPDTTAPVLSLPTDAASGSTGGTLTVTTDEGNGTLYWFVSTSSTPPTAANLKTGTGSVSFGNQAVSGTGVQNISAAGLTASTAYFAHFLHRDAAGNDSSIASGDGFTTTAPSAWAPTNFGSALAAWYDASDNATVATDTAGTTPATAGSSTVAYFGDKSGNGNHQTQATSGNRPTYVTDALFSYKAVKFTAASSQYLRRASAAAAAIASGSDNGFTVVAAVRRETVGSQTRIFTVYTEDATARRRSVGLHSTNRPFAAGFDGTTSIRVDGTDGSLPSDTWYVGTWVFSGTAWTMFINGVAAGSGAQDLATMTLNNLLIGAEYGTSGFSGFFNGTIGELLFVDTTTRTADVQSAETYLAAKWQ